MTTPTKTPTPTVGLLREIARDLLHAAVQFDGDPIDAYVVSGSVTQITPDAPVWWTTAIAAAVVRRIVGRTSIDDRTDDPIEAKAVLQELYRSVTLGLFQRSISFSDARVMTAILNMSETAAPGSDGQRTVELALRWHERWGLIETWRLTYLAIQLIRAAADWSGDDGIELLNTLIRTEYAQ